MGEVRQAGIILGQALMFWEGISTTHQGKTTGEGKALHWEGIQEATNSVPQRSPGVCRD